MKQRDKRDRRVEEDGRPLRHDVLTLQDMASGAAAAVAAFRADIACALKALGVVPAVAAELVDQVDAIEGLVVSQGREIRRLRDDLDAARDDAGRDALTGLPNRRAGEALLAAPVAEGSTRSIAFVDIDRFKSINDTYGHGFGDRVLRHVAEVLIAVCGSDRVHRWGGEEFLVVLNGMPAWDAVQLVDAARIAVAAMELRLRADDPPLGPVTFSAGVSDERDGHKAVAQADELLYFAKHNGRNQVATSDMMAEAAPFPTSKAA